MSTPPILLPDVESFSDLLEYVSEWDSDCMTSYSGSIPRPDLIPSARYLRADGQEITREQAFTPNGNRRYGERAGNEIGPFCVIDMSQLDGTRHRSIAVRATDAVIDAVRHNIVTPDDHLSFSIIGHKHTGRALVILQHNYISGSRWLAYIDPATIPAYPFAARDFKHAEIRAAMEAAGARPVICGYGRGKTKEPHSIELRDGFSNPRHGVLIHADGAVTGDWR